MALSRSACWNCSSMRWRSVTSSATARIPVTDAVVVEQRSGRHRQLQQLVAAQGRELDSHRRLAVPGPVPQSGQSRRRPVVGSRDAQRPVGYRAVGRAVPTQQRARRAVPPPGRAREVELGDGQGRGLHHGLETLLVALHRLVQAGVVERDRRHLGQQDEDRLVLGVERRGSRPSTTMARLRVPVESTSGTAIHGTARAPDDANSAAMAGSATSSRPPELRRGRLARATSREAAWTTGDNCVGRARWGRSPPPLRPVRRPSTRASCAEARRGEARAPRPARRRGRAGRARTAPAAPAARPGAR